MTNWLLVTTVGKLRNRLHRLLKQRYAVENGMKMTVEEVILLYMLDAKTNQILQNIAIATGKNKSVILRMIDSLEEKGLVRRTVNPQDRRENFLAITEVGERVLDRYREIERQLSDELLKDIAPEKIEAFFEVIGRISEKMDKS